MAGDKKGPAPRAAAAGLGSVSCRPAGRDSALLRAGTGGLWLDEAAVAQQLWVVAGAQVEQWL